MYLGGESAKLQFVEVEYSSQVAKLELSQSEEAALAIVKCPYQVALSV